MNIRFLFLWLLLVFCCTVQTFAQQEKKVLGKIIDSTRTPLQGVSIKLSVAGSTDTLQTVSDKKGQFSFTVTASKFVVTVSATEFMDFNQEYRFNGSYSIFQLGEIQLYPNYKILNTVYENYIKY